MSVSVTPYRAALLVNSTSTSAFGAKIPTITKPSGAGIVDLTDRDLGASGFYQMPRFVQLLPFGTDGADDTFDMQLWGWSFTAVSQPSANATTAVTWIPQLLLELNVVLGSIAAPANSLKSVAQYLADAITIAKGDADAPEISPSNNFAASILCHLRGCSLLEFVFKADAGAQASTGANCLFRVMDQ